MRRSWEVGTPRRGVRSAQRADPTNPFPLITDALRVALRLVKDRMEVDAQFRQAVHYLGKQLLR